MIQNTPYNSQQHYIIQISAYTTKELLPHIRDDGITFQFQTYTTLSIIAATLLQVLACSVSSQIHSSLKDHITTTVRVVCDRAGEDDC